MRRVELETGDVLQAVWLAEEYFAEGLALWQDRLIQLTWREHIAFVWDAVTFAPQGSFPYVGVWVGSDPRRPALDHERRVVHPPVS